MDAICRDIFCFGFKTEHGEIPMCVDLPLDLNVLKKKRLFVETYHFLTLSIACITRLMSSLARDLVSARTALDIILK